MKDNMAERLRSLITIYAHFFRIILSPDKRNSFASDLYDNCIFHLESWFDYRMQNLILKSTT